MFEDMKGNLQKGWLSFLEESGRKFFERATLKHTVSQADLEENQPMALTGSLGSTLALQPLGPLQISAARERNTIPVRIIQQTGGSMMPTNASG